MHFLGLHFRALMGDVYLCTVHHLGTALLNGGGVVCHGADIAAQKKRILSEGVVMRATFSAVVVPALPRRSQDGTTQIFSTKLNAVRREELSLCAVAISCNQLRCDTGYWWH